MTDAELELKQEMELEAQAQATAKPQAKPQAKRRPLSEWEQEERWKQDDLMERMNDFMREDY